MTCEAIKMDINERKEQVLDTLRTIIDPDLGQDIVTLGFVKNLEIDGSKVSFTVELTTPACPLKASFKKLCDEAVCKLSWVDEASVTMSAREQRRAPRDGARGLADVQRIIAVASCKGGVGKSTVAVNLAFQLRETGARVGLLDADIFGPSLPTLVRTKATALRAKEGKIQPIVQDGVKLISFGYAVDKTQAAIMRGPMVSGIISQLATDTDWGALDYLVVDMPPGTGDIQLTLTQKLPFTGAVIVTTPQKLSFVDVIKGMQMFETVKVPTLAVVENMSYFVCSSCKEKHYPFGMGALERLTAQYGIENAFEIPMLEAVTETCDRGVPAVLAHPTSDLKHRYENIAGAVVREIERLENNAIFKPAVRYEAGRGILVATREGDERVVDPADLRRRCGCASCKDEYTGEQILNPEDVPDDVFPEEIEAMGNYAVAIRWSDGHASSIYPYEKL
jgi:Mrp family chromosome partitioning ATPase/DUF971 family protein